MEALSRKRISPPDEDDARTSKRLRTGSSLLGGPVVDGGLTEIQDAAPGESHIPTIDEQARGELRRSIVLALQHVGFESASCDTLESFTMLVESCESIRLASPLLRHAALLTSRGGCYRRQIWSRWSVMSRSQPTLLDARCRARATSMLRWRAST